jgi:Xaa-Pro aminopeptidase
MNFRNINNIKNIQDLLLFCRAKRFDNIVKEICELGPTYIKSVIITNDFQKPIIDPYFLYVTMLPIDIIALDSLLCFEIINKQLVLKIYSNNYDNESGIKYNLDLLNKMGITIYKLNYLPDELTYIGHTLKKKLNKLRLIKDEWEFLQIYDCLYKTNNIFKKMAKYIENDKNVNEGNLESIYYKYLLRGNYRIPYLPIIGSGKNASYIHYFNNNNQTKIDKSNVILMDCGVRNIYGYNSDITRTIINNSSTFQIKIYNIVKKAHDSCVDLIRNYLKNKKKVSLNYLQDECINTFIKEFAKFEDDDRYPQWSKGIHSCKNNLHNESNIFIKNFYTHYIGHNIGLEAHDPNDDYYLTERCIFTIEPGLYFNRESIDFEIPNEFYDLGGIRIEDMYTILENSGELNIIHLSNFIRK